MQSRYLMVLYSLQGREGKGFPFLRGKFARASTGVRAEKKMLPWLISDTPG